MDISSRLKFLRIKKGISQKEIADYIKVKINTYSQYENNRRKPDYETLIDICDYYEVSPNYLLNSDDDDILFDDDDNNDFSADSDFQNTTYLLNEYVRLIVRARKIMIKLDSLDLSYPGEYEEHSSYKEILRSIFSDIMEVKKNLENFINIFNIEDEIIEYLKL